MILILIDLFSSAKRRPVASAPPPSEIREKDKERERDAASARVSSARDRDRDRSRSRDPKRIKDDPVKPAKDLVVSKSSLAAKDKEKEKEKEKEREKERERERGGVVKDKVKIDEGVKKEGVRVKVEVKAGPSVSKAPPSKTEEGPKKNTLSSPPAPAPASALALQPKPKPKPKAEPEKAKKKDIYPLLVKTAAALGRRKSNKIRGLGLRLMRRLQAHETHAKLSRLVQSLSYSPDSPEVPSKLDEAIEALSSLTRLLVLDAESDSSFKADPVALSLILGLSPTLLPPKHATTPPASPRNAIKLMTVLLQTAIKVDSNHQGEGVNQVGGGSRIEGSVRGDKVLEASEGLLKLCLSSPSISKVSQLGHLTATYPSYQLDSNLLSTISHTYSHSGCFRPPSLLKFKRIPGARYLPTNQQPHSPHPCSLFSFPPCHHQLVQLLL